MIRNLTVVERCFMCARIFLPVATLILLCVGTLPSAAQALERHTSNGGTYLIDWRGDFNTTEQQTLRAWLDHMGTTIAMLHGTWPRERIRIAFQPYRGRGPVPFARILRNAPEGILFYVDPAEPPDAFVSDWTAYHEFAHLFIPYPGRADAWFSEGLASYYQNILQVRAGVLTVDEARERLTAAFQRGTDDNAHDDLTLGQLSSRMLERRAFMRVYWSGALYFLEADLRLREAVGTTLDDILRDFGQCCVVDGVEMRARAMAAEFDRIAATDLFLPLYDRYDSAREMPEWRGLVANPQLVEILTGPASDASQ